MLYSGETPRKLSSNVIWWGAVLLTAGRSTGLTVTVGGVDEWRTVSVLGGEFGCCIGRLLTLCVYLV
jgi:hypothetical protein